MIDLSKTITSEQITDNIETPLRGLVGILDTLAFTEADIIHSQEVFKLLKESVQNIIDNRVAPIKENVDYMFQICSIADCIGDDR